MYFSCCDPAKVIKLSNFICFCYCFLELLFYTMQPFLSIGVGIYSLCLRTETCVGQYDSSAWRSWLGLVLPCEGAPKGSEKAQYLMEECR